MSEVNTELRVLRLQLRYPLQLSGFNQMERKVLIKSTNIMFHVTPFNCSCVDFQRGSAVLHNTRDYWILGHWPSPGVLKNTAFRKLELCFL
jgi:hypothetical protein